jgi:MSHA biogenesis protein MshK
MKKLMRAALLAASWPALATAAAAAGLPDPTRPPSALMAAEGAAVAVGQPVLQSVMISPARRVAIISGQAVALGQTYGGARVTRITENEVVLRNGSDAQVLRLFPDLEKQPASGGSGIQPPRRP